MKKIIVILGCAALLLSACGKKDEQQNKVEEQVTVTESQPEVVTAEGEMIEEATAEESEEPEVKFYEDELTKKIDGDSANLQKEFAKLDDAQKYYFCASFAMGAMSAAKPITASVMVTYFLGLGVAKYDVGIDHDTYTAFNAGKNIFMHENLINTVLEDKFCDEIVTDATEFAAEKKLSVDELEKLGQVEVEKVVKFIHEEN